MYKIHIPLTYIVLKKRIRKIFYFWGADHLVTKKKKKLRGVDNGRKPPL